MTKAKKQVFSVTKAVKANARERVGMPRPEAVIPDDRARAERRASKHKETLERLLERENKA
jgi:hypothetical protein